MGSESPLTAGINLPPHRLRGPLLDSSFGLVDATRVAPFRLTRWEDVRRPNVASEIPESFSERYRDEWNRLPDP
jgi:hypothetical protein